MQIWEVTEKKDATCTAEGSIHYTCTKCNETKTDIIEKLAHNIVTVVDSQPTCGAAGKQHQECSVCHGERKDLEDLPATGNHDWKESKQDHSGHLYSREKQRIHLQRMRTDQE